MNGLNRSRNSISYPGGAYIWPHSQESVRKKCTRAARYRK